MADDKPIIIKKVKKGGHEGHHGGAWKIAYADFVTAMMAFFLLMWLLNATDQEQKRGIANYFDPVAIESHAGGGTNVMMGDSITSQEKSAESSRNPMSIKESKPQEKGAGGEQEARVDARDVDGEAEEQQRIVTEQASFDSIKKEIEKALTNDPELKEWLKNLLIDETLEGLRIQIVDQHEKSMFPNGSSKMYDHTRKLLKQVGHIIQKVPNKLSVSGHTDATPYSTKDYTNWELSVDRANASRRALEETGLSDTRFLSVIGKEAKEPFVKTDPFSPQNRRISIVLLRQTPIKTQQLSAKKV